MEVYGASQVVLLTWLMGLRRWTFFTCEVLENGGAVFRKHRETFFIEIQWNWKQVMVTWRYFTTWSKYCVCFNEQCLCWIAQKVMCIEITFLDSGCSWFALLEFHVEELRVGLISLFDTLCQISISGFFTKIPAANYRINLMTLIRHCMSPHYRCPLFSLFCDLSSNHVQHTMITMWSSHCEESPPKKECSLFQWISNLHGSTKHDLQRHDHHIFMLEELQ